MLCPLHAIGAGAYSMYVARAENGQSWLAEERGRVCGIYVRSVSRATELKAILCLSEALKAFYVPLIEQYTCATPSAFLPSARKLVGNYWLRREAQAMDIIKPIDFAFRIDNSHSHFHAALARKRLLKNFLITYHSITLGCQASAAVIKMCRRRS